MQIFTGRKISHAILTMVITGLLLIWSSSACADQIDFGAPHSISIAFKNESNLEEAIDQLSNGIGASFEEIETFTKEVDFGNCTKTITFKRAYTTRGTPFIELLTADPYKKPWHGGALRSSTAVWAVDDVAAAEAQIAAVEGAKFLARVAGEFAYYELIDGIQIKVVNRTLVPDPATSTANTPPFGTFDFGLMNHFSRATKIGRGGNPDDHAEAIAQTTAATGLVWGPSISIPDVPYTLPDGRTAIVTHPHQGFSVQGGPYLDYIDADPSIQPWVARNHRSQSSIVWGALDMAAAADQLEEAGFDNVIELNIPGLGFILAYYEGVEGMTVQIAYAPLLPPAP